MHSSTFYKRQTQDGYTVDEALLIPKGMPRWMWQVQQEEGCSIIEVIKREKLMSVSDADIARSFGVKKDTLGYWIRKFKREGKL